MPSAAPASPQPLDIPSFPSPSALSFLPQVHALLSRLLPNAASPLDPKDLPTEAAKLKAKIQAAKILIDSLPDVDRTVEEQEAEIRELEAIIARRSKVLRGLGVRANEGLTDADSAMAGVEKTNGRTEEQDKNST